jgi:hypothetical protein
VLAKHVHILRVCEGGRGREREGEIEGATDGERESGREREGERGTETGRKGGRERKRQEQGERERERKREMHPDAPPVETLVCSPSTSTSSTSIVDFVYTCRGGWRLGCEVQGFGF